MAIDSPMVKPHPIQRPIQSVSVIGAGVAGLAAACALAEAGYRVQVLERRPYVGGRASSYEHPGTGEVIDNCQHILLGCCTSLIDLYRRLGVSDQIAWFDRITFLAPDGRRSVLSFAPLPAPLHTAISFARSSVLSWKDKAVIARGIFAFMFGGQGSDAESFAQWLKKTRQTPRAVERFWKPVLLSALNEEPDQVSVRYAAKVFREAFLFSAEAGRMGVPRIPLSELYGAAHRYIEERGGKIHLRAGVESLRWDAAAEAWELTAGAHLFSSDAVVMALSFESLAKLLPALPEAPARAALAVQLASFEHSPITSVHLWFDREITDLDHAALLDTTMQWMYNAGRLQPRRQANNEVSKDGSYIELVVSASKMLTGMQRQEIVDLAMRELALFFPLVKQATLLKAAVVKEVRATYSVRPGLDLVRPGAVSGWPRLFLAGDWTATDWPATMEGAVRSGYLAAEALSKENGRPQAFVAADLPRRGLMRLLP
ncbi:MAG: hydroxysqualene dehydroxylase HpnE [Acidobacteriaceae bacterium]